MNRVIRALAERQDGVVARSQLLTHGLSSAAVDSYVQGGLLIPIHAGVYAVGHPTLTRRGRLLGAVLAYGPTALLSHRTAAAEWDLLSTAQTLIDVTVPGTSRKRQPGIRVHRARRLHAEDITNLNDVPITSLARTILDIAGTMNTQQRLEVVEQADRIGILDLSALQRALDRRPNIRGARRLQQIIDDYTGAPSTRSKLERDFLTLITEAGLPRPQLNVEIAGLVVDVYWPQWRLVIELDSRSFHLNPRAFEKDRERDAWLQRLGIRILRITHQRMTTAPQHVIDDILALAALAA